MQKIIFILLASVLASSNITNAANKNEPASSNTGGGKIIVKWVDSNGITHYGDKLPAQEAGRSNSEMNNQGIVVKQNVISDKKNDVADQLKLQQERKDKILLASYTRPEEIDLARDRNLQLDQAALQALTQQKINVTARTTRNNKAAAGFQASKKPIPPYLSEELKLSKTESANIDKQLAQRKLSMEDTRKHYAEEKAKFIALKYPDGVPATTDAPKVEATPATGRQPATTNPLAPKPNALAVPTINTAPTKPK